MVYFNRTTISKLARAKKQNKIIKQIRYKKKFVLKFFHLRLNNQKIQLLSHNRVYFKRFYRPIVGITYLQTKAGK